MGAALPMLMVGDSGYVCCFRLSLLVEWLQDLRRLGFVWTHIDLLWWGVISYTIGFRVVIVGFGLVCCCVL